MNYDTVGGITSTTLLPSSSASTDGLQQALFKLTLEQSRITESKNPFDATMRFRDQSEANEIVERQTRSGEAGNGSIYFSCETTPVLTSQGYIVEDNGEGGLVSQEAVGKRLIVSKTVTTPIAEFDRKFAMLRDTEIQQYTFTHNPILIQQLANAMSTKVHDVVMQSTGYYHNKFVDNTHAVLASEFTSKDGKYKIALPYLSRISDAFLTNWVAPMSYPTELYGRSFNLVTYETIIKSLQEVIKPTIEVSSERVAVVANGELWNSSLQTLQDFLPASNETFMSEFSNIGASTIYNKCKFQRADRRLEDKSFLFAKQTTANINKLDVGEYQMPTYDLNTGNQLTGYSGGTLGASLIDFQVLKSDINGKEINKLVFFFSGGGNSSLNYDTNKNYYAVHDAFFIDNEYVDVLFTGQSNKIPQQGKPVIVINSITTDPNVLGSNPTRNANNATPFNWTQKDPTWLIAPVDTTTSYFTSRGITPVNPAGKFVFACISNQPWIVGVNYIDSKGNKMFWCPEGKPTILIKSAFTTANPDIYCTGDGYITIDDSKNLATPRYKTSIVEKTTLESPEKLNALKLALFGKVTGGSCRITFLVNNYTPAIAWRGDMVYKFPFRFSGLRIGATPSEIYAGNGRYDEIFTSREEAEMDIMIGTTFSRPRLDFRANTVETRWQMSLGIANNNTNVAIAALSPISYSSKCLSGTTNFTATKSEDIANLESRIKSAKA